MFDVFYEIPCVLNMMGKTAPSEIMPITSGMVVPPKPHQ